MAQQRLTTAFVKSVTDPKRYGDGGRGSFGLSLLVKRAKHGDLIRNWQQRYLKKDGKPTSRGLGVYPEVSLAQARAMAVHFAMQDKPRVVRLVHGATDEQLAERLAPVRHAIQASTALAPATATVEVNSERRPPTFRWVFTEALEHRKRGFKAGSRTEAQAKQLFDAYIPPNLADRPIEEVTSRDLVDALAVVWREKPATAKKLDQHLGATFDHAIASDAIDANPLSKAKVGLGRRKGSNKHHDALPHNEVAAALRTIRETSALPVTKKAFEFLVLTACRSAEVRGALWSEIDLDARTWTIPASRMKAGRLHKVSLSTGAMAVLDRARELSNDEGLVFPSERGKELHSNKISKMLRENGIDGTAHGMRASFRTWSAECSDVPREIAEFALAHVEGSAAELAYRRTDYFEKRRQLMEDWSNYVL